jgi:hypothetical protein
LAVAAKLSEDVFENLAIGVYEMGVGRVAAGVVFVVEFASRKQDFSVG